MFVETVCKVCRATACFETVVDDIHAIVCPNCEAPLRSPSSGKVRLLTPEEALALVRARSARAS